MTSRGVDKFSGGAGASVAVTELEVNVDGRCEASGPLPRVWLVDSGDASIGIAALRSQTRLASEAIGSDASGGTTPAGGAACTSRSYRYPFALIGTHHDVLGVDIERVDPFDEEFAESICMPSEWMSESTQPRTAEDVADVWSTKEALAKALGNALDYDPRRLLSLALVPGLKTSDWQAARVSVPAGYVGWVVWRVPYESQF